MSSIKRLAIIGAGDLGQQLAHFAFMNQKFEAIGFIDDTKKPHEIIKGIPVLGKIEQIQHLYDHQLFDSLLIGIGYKHMDFRAKLFHQFADKIPFATLIHPSAIIDPSAKIEQGVVIYPACVLDSNTVINYNVLINLSCTISHHSEVGAHSFLAPSVKIAGFCKIGNKNVLGIGTTIIDHTETADQIKTGGGTVVIKNLETSGTYVGNPARFIGGKSK